MNRVISRILAALLAMACANAVVAQEYPSKPVKFIVGGAPGSTGDVLGRILAEQLSTLWRQPVIVENRPGAGGILATQAALDSPADGYTLLVAAGSYLTVAPWVTAKMPYDVEKDLVPVGFLAEIPLVFIVPPELPAKNLAEFIEYAKKNPGKINYAANTPGTFPHLATALFANKAGVNLTYVPYKGSAAAMQDLLGGRIEMAVEGVSAFAGQINSGAVRPIAVTSERRLPSLSAVAAVNELVPGYTAVGFYAMMARAGVPSAVVNKVNADMQTILSKPDVAAKFVQLGNYVKLMSPADTAAFVSKERAVWGGVVEKMGFKPK